MNLFELFVKIGVKDEATKNIEGISSKLGNGLKTAAKIGTAAVGAAAAGIVALTKSAVENYAEYEQLVGGVETLFGTGGKSIEEYAKSVGKSVDDVRDEYDKLIRSQELVMDNASNAYKTAGMSANDYMENVTAFSASLIGSLGGDTEAAAEYANRAMVSMSDNANKMGTNIDSIVQTYQSLSRGNFAMLDNLKLGYGGTKAELERLIADASTYTDIQKEMGITVDASSTSFDNIVNAIAVVQEHLGIAGATAQEAGTTIEGSVNSMKSAWQNLITGIADDNADFEVLIGNFVESAGTALDNILPRIEQSLNGAAFLVDKLFPIIVNKIPEIITNNLPNIANSALNIIETLVNGLTDNVDELIPSVIEIISTIVKRLTKLLPKITQSALDLIITLAEGLITYLPELTDSVVDIILKIVDVLTNQESLNKLLKAAFSIITELAWGLIKNINKIIDATMTLLDGMIDFLLRPASLAMLIETAIQLVLAIGTGIIKAIPQLLVSVTYLITSIFANFATADWASIGTNLVAGLKKGISNAWANLKSWFRGLFGDLIGVAKKILGIASPSKVFAEIGKFMAEGVGVGWNSAFKDIQRDINDSLDFDGGYIGSFGGVNLNGADGYASRDINIVQNIYSQAKTAAELMREARWQAKMEVLTSV